MTSNRPLEEWGKLLSEVPNAGAILDRFLRHATTIAITGRRYRMKDAPVINAPAANAKQGNYSSTTGGANWPAASDSFVAPPGSKPPVRATKLSNRLMCKPQLSTFPARRDFLGAFPRGSRCTRGRFVVDGRPTPSVSLVSLLHDTRHPDTAKDRR
jgi:hypothetical protein